MRALQDRHIRLAISIGIIAIAVRFIAINQPFVDRWSWRQSDVASIARNFYTNGFHFAYPQIDWAGEQAGYVGTEFPILPFAAAVSYKILGVHEWIGRAQGIVLFAISLPFFFLFLREIFGAPAATWAVFFYCFAPLSVMTSRCFMPDMPSLSLSMVGLYFFAHWIANEMPGNKLDRFNRSSSCSGRIQVCAGGIAISLSILIKAPSAIIGAPLAYLAFEKFGISAFRKWQLWIFAAVALVPSAIWYWHAHNVAEKFYPHHFFGAGGFRIENVFWYWKIAEWTTTSSLTSVLAILAIAGMFFARLARNARVLYAWLTTTILFIIVVGYGNRHPWYQLPLVPIAAAFAGCACNYFTERFARQRWLFTLVIAIGFIFPSYYFTQKLYRESASDLRALGLEVKRATPPGSLIIAPDYGDPTVFYYAERRGWHFLEIDGTYNGHPISSAEAIDDLEKLRARGATHLVFYPKTLWWLTYYKEFAQHVDLTARLVEDTPQFKIYRLN